MKPFATVMMTVLLLCGATQMMAQQPNAPVRATLRNLSAPGAPTLAYGNGLQCDVKKTDELEISWSLDSDSPYANGDYKLQCKEVRLLAILKLGAPSDLTALNVSDDPQRVVVRFKASDYAHLLDAAKPGLTDFESGTKAYVKFTDFTVVPEGSDPVALQVTERQLYVPLTLN